MSVVCILEQWHEILFGKERNLKIIFGATKLGHLGEDNRVSALFHALGKKLLTCGEKTDSGCSATAVQTLFSFVQY